MNERELLIELQAEHAELIKFNEKLDRERNHYRDQANRSSRKVAMAKNIVNEHFRLKKDDPDLTLRAIQTVLERCFES